MVKLGFVFLWNFVVGGTKLIAVIGGKEQRFFVHTWNQ